MLGYKNGNPAITNHLPMFIIYGILNCDTIKKTVNWFKANKIPYEFHDYKQQGISSQLLKSWIKQVGIETVVNKKSTTWRELSAADQEIMSDPRAAIPLIISNPSIIKRPVIESGGKVIITGFNEHLLLEKIKNP